MNTKNTNIMKTVHFFMMMVALLFVTHVSYAQTSLKKELREQVKEVVKENRKEERNNIIEQAKNIIKEKIKKQIKGKLVTIEGSNLTVQKDQTTYTVATTNKTELKRKFGADSSLGEFSVNDQLLIIGNRVKNADGTVSNTNMEATYIRNMSIQRRFAVFNGKVTGISSNSFTIQTQSRGSQTVTVSSTTQYKERNVSILFSDIKIGDNLIVKGELWNRDNNKIDAKTIIKLTSLKPTQTVN